MILRQHLLKQYHKVNQRKKLLLKLYEILKLKVFDESEVGCSFMDTVPSKHFLKSLDQKNLSQNMTSLTQFLNLKEFITHLQK